MAPSIGTIAYYAIHMGELRSIVQWSIWHTAVHERAEEKESANLKECFRLLGLTSRSFATVIQELHPELLVPVCLFYLALRGLDTIEDDMTIDIKEKEPLLRDFYNRLDDTEWNYNGNGPDEKDRELLVKFDVVTKEFAGVKEQYRTIVKDIAKKMGNGMADYCLKDAKEHRGVETIDDYQEYCHYVAGLVGEGCTRLFVEAGLANPALLKQRPELMESMGQLLQQTNIIRDVREDHDDNRHFWPREIWSKYVDDFGDLFKPENREKALNCQSEMIVTALQRADDCLFYMAGIKEQSVFNFVAIPQTMAIATLEHCYGNYAMFERNVKITKGAACSLMTRSTQNLQMVCDVFREHARKIHRKARPQDPNFLDISVACGAVEKFIESVFPTQTAQQATAANEEVVVRNSSETPEQEAKRKAEEQEAKWDMIYITAAVMATVIVITIIMIGAAWAFGARFDLATKEAGNSFNEFVTILKGGQGSKAASSTVLPAAADPSPFEGKEEL